MPFDLRGSKLLVRKHRNVSGNNRRDGRKHNFSRSSCRVRKNSGSDG